MRNRIIAAIAFSVSRVADEHTREGARGEFMRSSGGCTRVAATAEDAEVVIGGWCTKQKVVWCILPTGTTKSMVPSMWSRRSYLRKRRSKYVFHVKKLAAVWESLIGTRSRTGTSWMTAKGLELPDREEAKGLELLEGLELEKSAIVSGSEAAATPKRGGTARVLGRSRRRRQGEGRRRLGWC